MVSYSRYSLKTSRCADATNGRDFPSSERERLEGEGGTRTESRRMRGGGGELRRWWRRLELEAALRRRGGILIYQIVFHSLEAAH